MLPFDGWLNGTPIAVIEGGQIYLVRVDHIGRPVFATTLAGTKVWEVSYLPFGGVHQVTGAPMSARFPGQWFQTESGLHQNWMRDYDPTTGRYLQADPLGLVDGASVYGYAKQNPGRWVDPRGLYTIYDALMSWQQGHSGRAQPSRSDIFDEWLRLERQDQSWLDELLDCPCNIDDASGPDWQEPRVFPDGVPFHPGGVYDIRSFPTAGGHGSQCIYDAGGNLVLNPPGAGSADYAAFEGLLNEILGLGEHYSHDVAPYGYAESLGRIDDYYTVRPATP